MRLATLTDPAIAALDALLRPAAVKNHPAQALGAARDVLDRTGHKTPDELDVIQTTATLNTADVEGVSTERLEEVQAFLRQLLGRAE